MESGRRIKVRDIGEVIRSLLSSELVRVKLANGVRAVQEGTNFRIVPADDPRMGSKEILGHCTSYGNYGESGVYMKIAATGGVYGTVKDAEIKGIVRI